MEYCGNGDLSQTIKECRSVGKLLPEAMIWTYFTQIVLALYRCHNGVNPPTVGNLWEKMTMPTPTDDKVPIKILHRDLKPENSMCSFFQLTDHHPGTYLVSLQFSSAKTAT
jgi:serine/threonine protein kinase